MIAVTCTPAQAMQHAAKLFGIAGIGIAGYTMKQRSTPKKPAIIEQEALTPEEEVILDEALQRLPLEIDPQTKRPTVKGFLSQEFIQLQKFGALKECISKDCTQHVDGLFACMNVPQPEADQMKNRVDDALEAFQFVHALGKSCVITLEKARTPENNEQITKTLDMCKELRTIGKQVVTIFENEKTMLSYQAAAQKYQTSDTDEKKN
jgi:hypothetical protein